MLADIAGFLLAMSQPGCQAKIQGQTTRNGVWRLLTSPDGYSGWFQSICKGERGAGLAPLARCRSCMCLSAKRLRHYLYGTAVVHTLFLGFMHEGKPSVQLRTKLAFYIDN